MYTQLRLRIRDIEGHDHVGDWEDSGKPYESADDIIQDLRRGQATPVVILLNGQPRIFHQYAYTDVEAR